MEELLRIILKWSKSILLVCVIAAAGSAVISLLLPEIYSSSVILMTTNPHMMDRGSLFQMNAGSEPVYLFGGKHDVQRFITLAESRQLEGYLIEKFDLYTHYEIEKGDPEASYWLHETLYDNLKIVKMADNMIRIEVSDKNNQFAADMANETVKRLDFLNKQIITEKKGGLTELYNKKLKERKSRVSVLTDSLRSTIIENPEDTVTSNMLEMLLENSIHQYNKMTVIHDEHNSSMAQDYSTVYILEEATPSVKRAKPVRWLIVVSATLIALISMILMVVIIEKFKSFELRS